MSDWTVLAYPLSRAENRRWEEAMTRYPSGQGHEIEVSFDRLWAVELPDEYRVLLSLRFQSQGVIDLGNGWMIVPRAAAREARDALQSECGNWFIARTVRFRTARARAVWEALLQFS